MQLWPPEQTACSFSGQGSHDPPGFERSVTNEPAPHSKHCVALAPYAKLPGGQARQTLALVAIEVLLNRSAAHAVQPSLGPVEPTRSVNHPSGQVMLAQPTAPPGENRPGGQVVQLASGCEAPAGEARPAVQLVTAQAALPPPL